MGKKGYKVRLNDGSEVGPLDPEMLHSWYEQGLIDNGTPVLGAAAPRWTKLSEVFDLREWARPNDGRHGAGDDEDDAEPQVRGVSPRARSRIAAVLLLAGAVGAGLLAFYPARWTPALPGTPWQEIALAEAALGLLLIRGWDLGRKLVRVLTLLAAFAVFPLAGILIAQGLRGSALIVLASAWLLASGFFGFLSGRLLAWSGATLGLMAILAGAGGIYYFGYVPPGTARSVVLNPSVPVAQGPVRAAAAPPARAVEPAGAASAAQVQQAARAVTEEVPHLSPRSAELLMSQSAAGVLDPAEAFRRGYIVAGDGLSSLSAPEARELREVTARAYETLSSEDRQRLGAYIERVRGREMTSPEEDRRMSGLMKQAVLRLPAAQRARLQELFGKALEAGLTPRTAQGRLR